MVMITTKFIIKLDLKGMQLQPNILVTGTPGVGKTSLSRRISERLNLTYIDVGKIVKDENCYTGVDNDFDALELDEDKLIDYLEDKLQTGGCIVDFHTPEIFPERWFDLVLVLTSTTEVLYDRLTARGYLENKINENMECEIMQVVLLAAQESYDENIVVILTSNNDVDMTSNLDRVAQWHEAWLRNNNNADNSDENSDSDT